MTSGALVAALALVAVLVAMGIELLVSRANERAFRARGAIDAPDAVYGTMRWAYPGAFVAMALEAIVRAQDAGPLAWAGVVLFAAAKGLKAWAIASLGRCWTYRLLVLPGMPLVTRGPYRFLRHPNYVAVVGELVAMALMTGAQIAGPLGTLAFMWLLHRRIRGEERALGLRPVETK
jgi:methyltransferase